jgi:hypothetical protein
MQSNVKNVIFTCGKTNFRLFLVIGQSNGPLQEKKTIKHLCFGMICDAPQLI